MTQDTAYNVTTEEAPMTWRTKIAMELANDTVSAAHMEGILDAAAEMATIPLKVALARCYEIISIAEEREEVPIFDGGFLEEIRELASS